MERISLGNVAFEGNNNAYLLDDEVTALVDTGDPMPDTREEFEAALADNGVTFADIDEVFLTHWHGDHTGLAGAIQQESGATVHVHHADAPLVVGEEAAHDRMRERQERLFDEWGMPEEKQEQLLGFFEREFDSDPVEVTTFEDGETFDLGTTDLTVVHAPGHAAGLSCFAFDGARGREMFSGDALLPVYTPNVGGADVRVEEPLRRYLETLVDIAQAEYERAWPGHRDPIDDPTGRAEYIIHHHEERSWRVLDVLDRQGPADPWTVSAELFGELESIHILHGPGEAYAHLDHLHRDGAIERTEQGYALTPSTADRLANIDDETWPLVEWEAGHPVGNIL